MHATPSSDPITPEPVASEAFLRMAGVSKVYPMGDHAVFALRSVDLSVAAGTFTAVVGRSGSGKSTLLHLLAALETPTAGEVTVGAWRLSALDRKAQTHYRRAMVGMIFQAFHLVPTMTAFDNVALPLVLAGVAPERRRARAEACLEMVRLTHRAGHRPAELSGGERQRVAIARALVADPPLLLADEPTGNLDSTTAAQIVDLLARLRREHGKTVVFVTHHFAEVAAVADRVVELNDGRIVGRGGAA
ncbi:ABC transporter ATP-binding protein [Rhodocaloribacter sp.]